MSQQRLEEKKVCLSGSPTYFNDLQWLIPLDLLLSLFAATVLSIFILGAFLHYFNAGEIIWFATEVSWEEQIIS